MECQYIHYICLLIGRLRLRSHTGWNFTKTKGILIGDKVVLIIFHNHRDSTSNKAHGAPARGALYHENDCILRTARFTHDPTTTIVEPHMSKWVKRWKSWDMRNWRGLVKVVTTVLTNMTDVPMDAGEFEKLLPLVLEDARATGEDMC